MAQCAQQYSRNGSSTIPESHEGLHNFTGGDFVGDNTDAGPEKLHREDNLQETEVENEKQLELKSSDNSRADSTSPSPCPSESGAPERTMVSFHSGDPENPYNWSTGKKTYTLLTSMVLVLNSTIGSALPSGATRATAEYFHVTNQALLVLPVSIYLIGYVLGPLVRRSPQHALVSDIVDKASRSSRQ